MSIRFYPQNTTQKLGFDKITNQLYGLCLSELGQERVQMLDFATNQNVIRHRLAQAREMAEILEKEENFPVDHYYAMDEPIEMLQIANSALSQEALFRVLLVTYTIRDMVNFFKKGQGTYPHLEKLLEQVDYEKTILSEIDKVLDQEGYIKSSVSRLLKDIRKSMNTKEQELDKKFQELFHKAREKGWLSEEGESMRNGRRVLAVSSVHKKQVKGVIHDESSTGKTMFIEPSETSDISNEIFELKQEEKREIYRILRDLTDKIRPYKDHIAQYQQLLAKIDFIRAKALLGQQLNGVQPVIMDYPEIYLNEAVHPLLYLHNQADKEETVPLSLSLNQEQGILLISGPNAGGKSVAMKTAGILQMMVQAGLLVPVKEDSQVGIFQKLFVDIGDDQSIENDLSTYSSHLSNMNYFTENADETTLFLIDELGTGTDPELGGPIAEAILEYLNNQKAFGIVTTHYTNLKLFATEQPRLQNGSMLFDKENLTPTYQLAIGTPGSSYSFEVARNIGFKEEILTLAQQKVKKEYKELDELLGELEKNKQATQEKDQQLARKQKQLDQTLKKHKQLSDQLEQNKKQYLLESKQNALNHLNKLNREFENLVKDWKESEKADKEGKRKHISKKLQQQKRNLEKDVDTLQQKVSDKEPAEEKSTNTIEEGSYVNLKGGNQTGVVQEIKGKKALVIFDNLKTETNLKDLQKTKTPRSERKQSQRNFNWQEKAGEFKPTIDIRGKSKEEALNQLENWLDKAVLLNESQLKILHGKGDGVLKNAIRKQLKAFDFVKDFYSDYPEQGGDGVTLVEIK